MKHVDCNALRIRMLLIIISLSVILLILLGLGINTIFSNAFHAAIEDNQLGPATDRQASIGVEARESLAPKPQLDPAPKLQPLHDAQTHAWLLLSGGMLVVCLGASLAGMTMIRWSASKERENAALDAELIQSAKMATLGKMAAGVAHELNNPLAIIREQAGWMKDLLEEEDIQASPNFKEFEQAVLRIEKHVDRASGVTRRMLGFARRSESAECSLNLNALAAETLKFLETEARHRNIAITLKPADNLPCTHSDPAQLQQVLLNLVDNAIDAIGKDGMVTLTTACHQDKGADKRAGTGEISVAITDTGSGITPETLSKIFDPFYTTKKSGEGTGLGLAIAHSIMEKLGGRLSVTSTLGRGSTFTLFVPIK